MSPSLLSGVCFLPTVLLFSNLLFSGLDFKCWIGALDELLRSLRSAEDIVKLLGLLDSNSNNLT